MINRTDISRLISNRAPMKPVEQWTTPVVIPQKAGLCWFQLNDSTPRKTVSFGGALKKQLDSEKPLSLAVREIIRAATIEAPIYQGRGH